MPAHRLCELEAGRGIGSGIAVEHEEFTLLHIGGKAMV